MRLCGSGGGGDDVSVPLHSVPNDWVEDDGAAFLKRRVDAIE